MVAILQRDAPKAILEHQPFEAGALHADWQKKADGTPEFVVLSYEDVVGFWTPPTEFNEGYWTIHWTNTTSPTTLRHTRLLDRTVRGWAHAGDEEN